MAGVEREPKLLLRHLGSDAGGPFGLVRARALDLRPPPLGDVAEDHDGARQPAVGGPDRRGAVVDGDLAAVLRDEQGVVRQARDGAFTEDPLDGALRRLAGLLVDDDEHPLHGEAGGLRFRPAGQRLRDRVQPGHATVLVGRDDRVADARDRDPQPLLRLPDGGGHGLRRGPAEALLLALADGARHQQHGGPEQPDRDGKAGEAPGKRQPGVPPLGRLHRRDDAPDLVHGPLALAGLDPACRRLEAFLPPRRDRCVKLLELALDKAVELFKALLLADVVRGQAAEPVGLRRQRGPRRLVGIEVRRGTGEDEAPLAGLGILEKRENAFRLLPDDQRVLDLAGRRSKLAHLADGRPFGAEEEAGRDRETDDAQAPSGLRTQPPASNRRVRPGSSNWGTGRAHDRPA